MGTGSGYIDVVDFNYTFSGREVSNHAGGIVDSNPPVAVGGEPVPLCLQN